VIEYVPTFAMLELLPVTTPFSSLRKGFVGLPLKVYPVPQKAVLAFAVATEFDIKLVNDCVILGAFSKIVIVGTLKAGIVVIEQGSVSTKTLHDEVGMQRSDPAPQVI
jgi:hypothetical protein